MASGVGPLREAVKSCKQHFAWAAGFSALLNLLYMAPTLYMLQVYDRVIPARGDITLGALTAALVFALLTLTTFDTLRSRLFLRASIRLNRRLAGVIFQTAFSSRGAPEAVTRQVVREFDTLRQILTGPAMLALFDLPWIPFYLLVCFLLHPALGGVVTVGGLVLAALAWRNETATRAAMSSAHEATNRSYANQDRILGQADVARALGMSQPMINRQLAERESSLELQAEASFVSGGYVAVSRFVRLFLQSAALGVGAWLAIHDKISAGAIFAASFLAVRALGPFEQLLGSWKSIGQARDAWRTIDRFLSIGTAKGLAQTDLPAPTGLLEVEGLVVPSPSGERALLQGVSFRVEPGEIVALVGRSGAGKSTLLRALAGLTTYTGAVRFDSSEIKEYNPERLGGWIGFAPQDASLFPGTVKDNISRFAAYGDEPPEELDLLTISAAKSCGAHEMIARLPDGYDTVIGWNGAGLSAGQAQRIALARALYRSPRVLLLDEPDAHLDGEGEVVLARTLQALKAVGRTVIVASHRSQVLSAVDRMIIVEDGRLKVDGPRDAVLRHMAQAAAEAQRPRPVDPQPADAAPRPAASPQPVALSA